MRDAGRGRWLQDCILANAPTSNAQSDLSDEVGDADVVRLAGDVGEELDVEGDGDEAGADIGAS
jgi:hypothetical protein